MQTQPGRAVASPRGAARACLVGSQTPVGSGSSVRVLITGSEGAIGQAVAAVLEGSGHEICRFDLSLGDDTRSYRRVRAAVTGVDAVVHLASVNFDRSREAMLTTNILGTHNVVAACAEHRVDKVLWISSLNATGAFLGRRAPTQFPINEDMVCMPDTFYGASKLIAEQLCQRHSVFSPDLGILSLRLPGVWFPGRADYERDKWEADPTRQWRPFWEYGAFIDIQDVTALIDLAIVAEIRGHHVVNAASSDCASLWPALQLVERLHPTVPWRSTQDRQAYLDHPYRSLVDCTRIDTLIGWRSRHPFRGAEACVPPVRPPR